VVSVEIGLLRTRPEDHLRGLVRFDHLGDDGTLAAVEAGRALLEACLVVVVAAPLAVARVTGKRDESWVSHVERHIRYGLDELEPPLPPGYRPDYVEARRLCALLGLTLAEGLALGEAFLDEPGVMVAVHRVAWAVLDSAPDFRLYRLDFLVALELPAAVRKRNEALHGSARRALTRYERRRTRGVRKFAPVLLWTALWLLHLLLQGAR
jgi:hypothetical protein